MKTVVSQESPMYGSNFHITKLDIIARTTHCLTNIVRWDRVRLLRFPLRPLRVEKHPDAAYEDLPI